MTGDVADIRVRLKRVLPPWFEQVFPAAVLDGALTGPATLLSWLYSLYAYAQLQTRLQTMTDGFLDMFAADFFGSRITRGNLGDAAFQSVIQANLLPRANTRSAISLVLQRLTGRAPKLIEPWNPGDLGVPDGPGAGGIYLDASGGCGDSLALLPYQGFVTAYRPLTPLNADLAGLNVYTGGLDVGNLYLAEENGSGVTDADIIAAVENVRMGNTMIWLRILN